MKGKLFQSGAMALTLALASTVSLFSSCSSDDVVTQNSGKKELTISVSPSNSVGTRAGITSADIQPGTENTINHFVVGIFDGNGDIRGTVQTMNMANNPQLTIDAGDIAEGDSVLVAVNAPADLFNDVKTKDDFRGKTLTIEQALYGNPTHQSTGEEVHTDNNYIPMYGQGMVTKATEQRFQADIDVYHLVSKVTLAGLNVNFSDAFAGATFQPTEIFLANVPDKLGFSLASSSKSYYKFVSPVNYISGETKDGTSAYKYLTTGDLSSNSDFAANEANAEKTYETTKLPIFYTMPNRQVSVGDNGATFLVIKGKFSYNGKDETVYYPFYMNYNTTDASAPDGGTPKALHPNINYQVSITITGKGTNSPVTPVSSKVASVNVSVKDFVAVNQEYHDAGGFDEPAVVGEYVFNDGTWGKLENISATHYPIAVIFSNSTSEADKAKGYTHGYAMALVQAGPACAWATSSAKGVNAPVQDKFLTNIADIKADMDGLSETNKVLALSDAKTADELKTNYPSFYYATHFGTEDVNVYGATSGGTSALKAPDNVSPWYLGSIGQYYLVAKNLGGNMSDETDASWQTGGSTYWYIGSTSIANAAGVSTRITAAAEAMTKAGVTAYTPGEITCNSSYITWYWTSSEFSAGHGFNVYWDEGGDFGLNGNSDKSSVDGNNRGVRPVLAF